jgi:SAM-dependent MidA family methyltransferase
VIGFTDQHHFFTGIVSKFPELLQDLDAKSKRALQTLLHPEMLGRTFQVLGLAKAVDPDAKLSGFKFGRDPRAALSL